jgi:hypothetical protein
MLSVEQARQLGPSQKELREETLKVLTQQAPQIFADLFLELILTPLIQKEGPAHRWCEIDMIHVLYDRTFRIKFDQALPRPLAAGVSYCDCFFSHWSRWSKHTFQEDALKIIATKLRSAEYGRFGVTYLNVASDDASQVQCPPDFNLTPFVKSGVISEKTAIQIMRGTTEGIDSPQEVLKKISSHEMLGVIFSVINFRLWRLVVSWE